MVMTSDEMRRVKILYTDCDKLKQVLLHKINGRLISLWMTKKSLHCIHDCVNNTLSQARVKRSNKKIDKM